MPENPKPAETVEHTVTVVVDDTAETRARLEPYLPAEQVEGRLPATGECSCGEWTAAGEQTGVRAMAAAHEADPDTK